MTAFVFAVQGLGAFQPGYRASVWTFGKAANAHLRAVTGTC